MVDAVGLTGERPGQSFGFDSFVVGPSNRLAYQSALSIAMSSAPDYNPLFIYSDPGLGKTHLLRSIEKACLEAGVSVRYVHSKEFVTELVWAIKEHGTETFRGRYWSAEVLLLDDVQQLGGKQQTQEELFHLFNHLRQNGKRIVITSDRPPGALALLDDRLRSRFGWGLVTSIEPSDTQL